MGAGWPAGFVAHHYTRYLGDLSGGQLVRKALQREYGLGEEGTAFYAFPGVAVGAVKRRYREMLDAAPWDEAERARFVDEVSLRVPPQQGGLRQTWRRWPAKPRRRLVTRRRRSRGA